MDEDRELDVDGPPHPGPTRHRLVYHRESESWDRYGYRKESTTGLTVVPTGLVCAVTVLEEALRQQRGLVSPTPGPLDAPMVKVRDTEVLGTLLRALGDPTETLGVFQVGLAILGTEDLLGHA